MLAAILKPQNNSLSVENVPKPNINHDEVLVEVKACGVCHTDLHYIDHGVKTFKNPPIILGHEIAGIIISKGKDVNNVNIFDRVVIPAVLTCGSCKYCLDSKENLCSNMIMPGNHIHGGYAEYIAVPAKDLKIIPDQLSFTEAALVADALSTAYHAVFKRAMIKENSTVIVIGCGGVGCSIVQMCSIAKANVIALDINNSRLNIATKLGAYASLNTHQTDFTELYKSLSVKPDYIFEVAGHKNSLELAVKLAVPATKIIIVGYCRDKISLNAAKVMFYELDIIGSLGCKPNNLENVFELAIAGKINFKDMICNQYALQDINTALDDLRNSNSLRPVIVFK